jgi:hypothetical protein
LRGAASAAAAKYSSGRSTLFLNGNLDGGTIVTIGVYPQGQWVARPGS